MHLIGKKSSLICSVWSNSRVMLTVLLNCSSIHSAAGKVSAVILPHYTALELVISNIEFQLYKDIVSTKFQGSAASTLLHSSAM